MAIKFLDSITLETNEIQNVAVENLAADPTAAADKYSGRIIFNTSTDTLKYYDGANWINLDGTGNVDSVTASNGLTNAGTSVDVDIEPDYTTAANIVLSSAGTDTLVAASKVLVSVSNTVGPYTLTQLGAVINPLGFESWIAAGDSGSSLTVNSTDSTVYFGGGAKMSTLSIPASGGSTPEIQIIHQNTSRTDTTSTAAPGTGATFTAVDSVSSDSTGHVTAINLKTVTLPTASNITYTLPVAAGAANTAEIVLTPSSGATGGTVTIAGTANEIAITETAGTSGTITIGLPDDVTIANDLTVAGDASVAGNLTGATGTFTGLVSGISPTADANFATKEYVDSLVVGGLVFKGAYNAATNSPALEGASNIASTKGDTYVVDTDGTFIGEQVRVGDVIIVNENILANSNPALSKFTVVQANVDLASNTTVGLAKFTTANGFKGSMTAGEPALPQHVEAVGNGAATSYVVTHSLGTRQVSVEVYDNTTYETVQCKVVRTSTSVVTVSTANPAASSGLTVLVRAFLNS